MSNYLNHFKLTQSTYKLNSTMTSFQNPNSHCKRVSVRSSLIFN